jgi:hypothetical protein
MGSEGNQMPKLEERVTALEVRCDNAGREAAGARAAHRQNVELLNALRVTQAEHTRTLAEHTTILNMHTDLLGKLTVGMHDIQLSLKHLIERDGDGTGNHD